MITQHLIPLFDQGLEQLKKEIEAYPDDTSMWEILPGTANSGGNLCMHLLGNLQHYLGATLGDTGYVRNRDAEFKVKNIPRSRVYEEIDVTTENVRNTLEQLSKNELLKEFPILTLGYPVSTEYFLLHLLSHLSYHIGQINYHRRTIRPQSA
jgi:uncharacterized damage-inducible protein DinB